MAQNRLRDVLLADLVSKTGKCVFDDGVNEFVEKAKQANGFIFGSPVYYLKYRQNESILFGSYLTENPRFLKESLELL